MRRLRPATANLSICNYRGFSIVTGLVNQYARKVLPGNVAMYFTLIALTFSLTGCFSTRTATTLEEFHTNARSNDLMYVNTDTLERLKSADKPLWVMTSASWCKVCKELRPVYWRKSHNWRQQFNFVVIDVESNPIFTRDLFLDSIPKFLLYENGQLESATHQIDDIDLINRSWGDKKIQWPEIPAPERPVPNGPVPDGSYHLVAVSSDVANFAQEVLDQRKYLIQNGVKPSSITCWYVPPTRSAYLLDKEQFDLLLPELSFCRHLDLKRLHQAIQNTSTKNDLFYLYVTGHGINRGSAERFLGRMEMTELIKDQTGCEDVRDFHFVIGNSRQWQHKVAPIFVGACISGEKQRSMFTPGYLKSALQGMPANHKKVIVLNGCYSGGFVTSGPNGSHKEISSVANTTVITSANYNRTSFGCQPGILRTYFGAAYWAALEQLHPDFRSAKNLRETWTLASSIVEKLEARFPTHLRSNPQFTTNGTNP